MTSLRIGTWNVERPSVRGWKRPLRNPVIMEQIRSVNADIWVLTETHEVIIPGEDYASASTLQSPHYPEGERSATIWSRYPIIRQLETFDPYTAVCVEIKSPIGNLLVYGSIITYANDKGSKGNARMWEEHYKSILAHEADWGKLRTENLPICCAGDFNETLNDSRWYGTKKGRRMLEQALQTNHLECLTKDYRIDHICISQDWVSATDIFQWEPPLFSDKPVSDHWGYHCDLLLST
ncbi:MAG: endonuclease/exonuclease/phosphatase family protein [Thiolinea sp.]